MAFAFDPHGNCADEVRAIALSQVDGAIKSIDEDSDPPRTVHSLRQRGKKLRSLIQLIRPRFSDWRVESNTVRDLGKLLAGSRDRAVLAQTFDDLAQDALLSDPDLLAFRAKLDVLPAEQEDHARLLAQFGDGMRKLRHRIEKWDLRDDDFGLLRKGFRATYSRMQASMTLARAEPEAENFHAWRKQAKYHYYHLNLLHKAAPRLVVPAAEMAKELADVLGLHHDLAVFEATVSIELSAQAKEVADLLVLARARQARLTRQAFDLGGQLSAEKPDAIARRFEGYWNRVAIKKAEARDMAAGDADEDMAVSLEDV